jgi:hypothetical protein
MSDRVKGLTVTLSQDIKVDDIDPILNAIKLIKGVELVETHITNIEDFFIKSRTKVK